MKNLSDLLTLMITRIFFHRFDFLRKLSVTHSMLGWVKSCFSELSNSYSILLVYFPYQILTFPWWFCNLYFFSQFFNRYFEYLKHSVTFNPWALWFSTRALYNIAILNSVTLTEYKFVGNIVIMIYKHMTPIRNLT